MQRCKPLRCWFCRDVRSGSAAEVPAEVVEYGWPDFSKPLLEVNVCRDTEFDFRVV
jgi:hypothetical protein